MVAVIIFLSLVAANGDGVRVVAGIRRLVPGDDENGKSEIPCGIMIGTSSAIREAIAVVGVGGRDPPDTGAAMSFVVFVIVIAAAVELEIDVRIVGTLGLCSG